MSKENETAVIDYDFIVNMTDEELDEYIENNADNADGYLFYAHTEKHVREYGMNIKEYYDEFNEMWR